MSSPSAEDVGLTWVPVVPKLVHKRTVSNSWLTSYRVREAHEMNASFRLPNSIVQPRLPELMEIWRQAGLVFAHEVLSVPLDHVFSLASISLCMGEPSSWHHVSRSGVVHISDCVFSAVSSRVRAADASARMLLDSGEILAGRLSSQFLPEKVYERLRSVSPPLGSEHGTSTLISGGTGLFSQAATPQSLMEPLFDHDHDHVTAMTLVSAIERLAEETWGVELHGLELDFLAYIDLYPLPEISRTVMADGQFRGIVVQDGYVKAKFLGSLKQATPSMLSDPTNGSPGEA